jgi:hypothetical protein
MRNMGKFAHDWRRYAQYYLIERHEVCLGALRAGYSTCGVQLTGEEYVGNFWWARADWLAQREMDLLAIPWHMGNRYTAEDFLLSPAVLSSNDIQQHYCLMFVHHNLYDCPTPRAIYAHLPLSAPSAKEPLPTQKVQVPERLNAVTCPHTKQRKARAVKDNHGGFCVEHIAQS